MSIHCCLKNKNYLKSKRDFLSDYSRIQAKKTNMTLSGKYLLDFPQYNISFNEFDKYPSVELSKQLERLIKAKKNIKCEVILGNGSNGLLQNIIKILYRKGGNLITPFYSFDQAEFAVTSFNGYTKRVYVDCSKFTLDNIIKIVDKKTRMIYICNPNNLTGIFYQSNIFVNLAKMVNIPVVVDESGIEFTGKKSILELCRELPNNLIVLRSFSKAYGLANLRIGYLICSEEFKHIYLKNISTNEYTGISCLIALKILQESTDIIEKNIKAIIDEREKIKYGLNKMGIEIFDSSSNVVMTSTYFNNELLKSLKKANISVVPIYDREKNLHIRIAVQDKKTNLQFLKQMNNIIKNKNLILGECID